MTDTLNDNEDIQTQLIDSHTRIDNLPHGIVFFSLMNKRRRYFLPSVNNFFEDLQIPKLLCCHRSCSNTLLPIDSIATLSQIFDWKDVIYRISVGSSPGGSTISLIVKKMSSLEKFSLRLCQDIMNTPEIFVDSLRFALSTEDIDWILGSESASNKLSTQEILMLKDETKFHERRSHGLIGQQILDRFASIKYMGCEIYVDPAQYTLPSSSLQLGHELIDLISQTKEKLPANFNDWEDDDFSFDDEDYFEIDEDLY